MKNFVIGLLCFFSITFSFSQDLLSELDSDVKIDSSTFAAFKGLKIVNLESTKLAAKKDLFFIIAHRFGSVKGGIKELFGIDQSTIRFSFVYGFSDNFNIGLSRSSYNKVYDLSVKYKIKGQEINGFPVTIVGYNTLAINTNWDEEEFSSFESKHRLSYTTQLLISKKFNHEFSFQLVPIVVHENYVLNNTQDNTQFVLGAGGRYKLSNFVTLNMDYAYHMNRASNSQFKNPFSIGFDIETGGHVFQVHFTNAQPMYDTGFLTNASGDWGNGDFFFGFNLSRVF